MPRVSSYNLDVEMKLIVSSAFTKLFYAAQPAASYALSLSPTPEDILLDAEHSDAYVRQAPSSNAS